MFRNSSWLLGLAILVLASAALPASESSETSAVLLYVSDTYGCLGYPDWPGGISRHKLFTERERRTHPDALFIHTGNALAPFYFSRYDKGEFYAGALDTVGNVIWNLGFHDIDFGWQHLATLHGRQKSTSLLSSNLATPAPAPEPWLVKKSGGLTIGFIGLVEPRIAHLAVPGTFEGLTVRDPIETAKEMIAKHRKEVDVLVAVADLEEDAGERLAREGVGLDLVIAGSRHAKDWYTFFQGRSAHEIVQRTRPDGSRTMFLSGPRDGFELGKVTLHARRANGRWQLTSIEPAIIPLPKDAPADPQLWPRVQAHLKGIEKTGGQQILDRLQARCPGGLDGERLTRWVVSAMRQSVSAEIGILNDGALFKPDFHAELCWKDNSVTAMHLNHIFWAPNHVVKAKLLGKNLLELLEDDRATKYLRLSGLVQKDGQVLVNGRPLKPTEHYLVATSNYLVVQSPKSRGFAAALEKQTRFTVKGSSLEASAKGQEILLGKMFELQLGAWRKAHPEPDGAEPFELSPYPRQQTVEFRNVTLTVSDYEARGREKFPQVRNPKIATPDVRSVLAGGEVLVENQSKNSLWTHGLKYSYEGFKFRAQPVFNPADDVLLYTRYEDWSRTLLEGPYGLTFHPYAELAFDTEFTATRGNPKAEVLRTSLGVSARGSGDLDRLRLAVFREHDLFESTDTHGTSASYRFRKPIWGVRFESDTNFRYYFDDASDAADDLRYELYANNQLVVPVADELSVTFMGNIFYYKGKLIDETGSNLFLGIGLRFDRLWKPRHEEF